ncbi:MULTISPECIES: alpha-keto acid decarboxylase family protein [Pseudomonas]|uniref:alpha-keto acid decarboxylase family protein n=1 Tax=Pseudomonas TaxID=286 RepID=UPI00131FBD21|nr:thiamine pyrophosphate-binding protein [Pseudomonas sp. R76]QHD05342.1 hypothetical protein PspR76_06190 [Pseudomonas sp. R76]
MSSKLTVANHLINRLSEIGIRHVFGVPGDYNLELLDHIVSHPDVIWVGNTNELNAAYAADGYARQSGVAALVTTYGVGELSAINGIAGSYAEYVPVLQIVGSPLEKTIENRELAHHTLGDGVFNHFSTCAEQVTVAQTKLTAENALHEIDRVLDALLTEKRPGYIELPLSVVNKQIVGEIKPYKLKEPIADTSQLKALTEHLDRLLTSVKRPVLLAGFLMERFGLIPEVRALLEEHKLPNASLFMGKGVLDEKQKSYIGNYSGGASDPLLLQALDNADIVLSLGVRYTDNITASFSHLPDPKHLVDFQPYSVFVHGVEYKNIPLKESLKILTQLIARCKPGSFKIPATNSSAVKAINKHTEVPITQHTFWQKIQSFIEDGDLIIAEQGTSFFGSVTLQIGPRSSFIGQPLWGSIGYTLPATFGAMTANPARRTLLFIGDGSALLTVQELSSLLRDGHAPIIFLINNNGYTVERAIHGEHQYYNDIPPVDWSLIPHAFGMINKPITYSVRNSKELAAALRHAEKPTVMQFIEVHLGMMDLPPQLKAVSDGIAAKNSIS